MIHELYPEIEPYIITRTTQLDGDINPAVGYRWADEYDDEPA